MHRDKNNPLRAARRPLTAAAIRAVKAGQTVADGHGERGHGTLKLRRRENAGSLRTEWLFEWTVAGQTRRMSLGPYSENDSTGAMTLAQARRRAAELAGMVQAGIDPLAQRELAKAETAAEQRAKVAQLHDAQAKTLSALVAAYVQHLRSSGKERSAADVESMFRLHVQHAFPKVAALPAAQVQPEDIKAVLARLVQPSSGDPKGRTALKLRSYLGAAFKLALGASLDPMAPTGATGFGLTSNPAAAVPARSMAERFNKEGTRVLSADELRAYMAHVSALQWPAVRLALQLQLATGGQRMQQLLRLRREDVTADALVLHDPKGARAQARVHKLPLVPEVSELLHELSQHNLALHGKPTPHLFATRGRDGKPGEYSAEVPSATVGDISAAMLATGQAGSPFRGGDIRRTVETLMAERLRISKDDRAQLLSHGLTGVQDRHYDRAEYMDMKRAHLRRWNDYLHNVCIGDEQPENNVVSLTARAA